MQNVTAEFTIGQRPPINTIFEINANPTRVSQLENDLDFQTGEEVSISIENALIPIQDDISSINATINSFGDIVTYNASDFATAAQGLLADSALQPNDNISELTNDVGYITGITSSDVTNALGFTPYNSTNPNNYQTNVLEAIKVNNITQEITNKTVNIPVPTNNNQLTNGAGYITGITNSDVTTALGYTPYDSSNPNGYTTNVGTVTSVNNVSPINGNVTLSIPAAQVNSDWNATSGVALILNKPTIPTAVSELNNDSGYITGITGTDVTTALGYTPYNSTNPNGYTSVVESTVSGWGFTKNAGTVTSVNNVSPVNGNVSLTIPTVNNATLTIQKNGTAVKTFTANASTDVTANITVPTDTGDLTNNAGYITASALNGYQTTSNLVTSVSSASTDSQYPSAKLFYDTCGDIETLINAL